MSHGHSFNLKRKLRETQELQAQNENNDQLVFVLQFISLYYIITTTDIDLNNDTMYYDTHILCTLLSISIGLATHSQEDLLNKSYKGTEQN